MSTHNRVYYEKNHHCRFDFFELLNIFVKFVSILGTDDTLGRHGPDDMASIF